MKWVSYNCVSCPDRAAGEGRMAGHRREIGVVAGSQTVTRLQIDRTFQVLISGVQISTQALAGGQRIKHMVGGGVASNAARRCI